MVYTIPPQQVSFCQRRQAASDRANEAPRSLLRGILRNSPKPLPSLPTPPKQSLRLRRPGAKATEGSPRLHPRSKLRGIRRRRIKLRSVRLRAPERGGDRHGGFGAFGRENTRRSSRIQPPIRRRRRGNYHSGDCDGQYQVNFRHAGGPEPNVTLRPIAKPGVQLGIQHRLGLNQINKISDYLRLLQKNPEELARLAKDLLIGVTSFFPDP